MYMCTSLKTWDKQYMHTFTNSVGFVSNHTYQLVCTDLLVCGTLTISGMLLIYQNCVCLFSCLWSWVTDHSCQISTVTCSYLKISWANVTYSWQFATSKKISSTNISIWDQFSKYHLRSKVPAWESLRKVHLHTNDLAFILCLIFSEHFFYTSVICQLSSLSGRTSISDVLEMIQFKWFIAGSHIFSKFFLRISFGQTYILICESFFFSFYFLWT